MHDHVRVTTVTVGDKLNEEGTLLGVDPVLRELGRLVNGDDVHAVYLNTRDQVATSVVLGVG